MKEIYLDLILKSIYEASEKMLEIYLTDFNVEFKDDRSPVTLADRASSSIIKTNLKETGIPIISEEETIPDFDQRKKFESVWIVDPLDGTKEFVNKNDEFCICIAYVKDHRSVFGVIADPVNKKIILGGPEKGSFIMDYFDEDPFAEKNKLKMEIPEQMGLVYSKSHFSDKVLGFVSEIEEKYGELDVHRKGSALKFFDLVQSKAQFYPRLAPTMEWDIAAGQAIYEGVGGQVLDFVDREPLRYNKKSLYNPYFLAKPEQIKL